MRAVIVLCLAMAMAAAARAQEDGAFTFRNDQPQQLIIIEQNGRTTFNWKLIEQCVARGSPDIHDLSGNRTRDQIREWETRNQLWTMCKIAWEAHQSCALTN